MQKSVQRVKRDMRELNGAATEHRSISRVISVVGSQSVISLNVHYLITVNESGDPLSYVCNNVEAGDWLLRCSSLVVRSSCAVTC